VPSFFVLFQWLGELGSKPQPQPKPVAEQETG